MSAAPAPVPKTGSEELSVLARCLLLALIALIFIGFTWKSVTMFYTGDDLMNTGKATTFSVSTLAHQILTFWKPAYRPLGGLIYRSIYSNFGFDPLPLYLFSWLLLLINVFVGWWCATELAGSAFAGFLVAALFSIHGAFNGLYDDSGSLYDKLTFFFVCAILAGYAQLRRSGKWPGAGTIVLVSTAYILALNAKEGAVALPLLIAGLEFLLLFPQSKVPWESFAKKVAPLLSLLLVLTFVFLVGRLRRTEDLMNNPAYQPHINLAQGLHAAARYLTLLTYGHIPFHPIGAGIALFVVGPLLAWLAGPLGWFGLLWFLLTSAPIAFILDRPGFVMYLPAMGLGLLAAALIMRATGSLKLSARWQQHVPIMVVLLCFAFATREHAHHWHKFPIPRATREAVLSAGVARDHSEFPAPAHLLFIDDPFPHDGYDMLFLLRLQYHDPDLKVDRLTRAQVETVGPGYEKSLTAAFLWEDSRYNEVPVANLTRSLRLHESKRFTTGTQLDFQLDDAPAYVVSGVGGGPRSDPGRWTTDHAVLKFAKSACGPLAMKFWVPDFVANPVTRKLVIKSDGATVDNVDLSQAGMHELTVPMPKAAGSDPQYRLVDLIAEPPYRDKAGTPFGVILMRAAFSGCGTAGGKN